MGKTWDVVGIPIRWDMVPYDVQLVGGVMLHEGRIAVDGAPEEVLGSAAAADAFGVAIRSIPTSEPGAVLWRFEERPAG